MMYNIVQTGAKTLPGGLKEGLFKAAYQTDKDSEVMNEPITPARRHITILNINFNKFDIEFQINNLKNCLHSHCMPYSLDLSEFFDLSQILILSG